MSSPFVHRKRVLGFYFFDLSRDGTVTQNDFGTFGRRVAEQLKVPTGTAQYEKITGAFLAAWDAFGKPADKDNDNAITLSEFIDSYIAFLQHPDAKQMVLTVNATFFDAFDGNSDGKIDLAEYTAFLTPAGVSSQNADTAFKRLDRNGDGFISREEFASDWWEYWNSDDRAAPGNCFLGAF